jgi:transcriptional regulator with XRE-family HTH domain
MLGRKPTLNQSVLDKVNDMLAYNKITVRSIARKLGTSESAVSRTLSGKYSVSLGNLERLCNAAGIIIEFTVRGDVGKGLLSEDEIRIRKAKEKPRRIRRYKPKA